MSRIKSIYVVREGRTTTNLEEKMMGLKDSPFAPEMDDVFKRLGSFLNTVSFDAFFVSPLPRALRSYQSLALKSVGQMKEEPCLKAMSLGDYEGKRWTDFPKEFQQRMREDGYSTQYPNGESFKIIDKRIKEWLGEIDEAYAGKTIGILGHWTSNAAIVCALMGWQLTGPFDRFMQPHNALYRFENGGLDFRTFGEIDWYRYRP